MTHIRGRQVERGGERGWTARGGLCLPLELFRVAMNLIKSSYKLEGLKDVSLTPGPVSHSYLSGALHGPHCLIHDFKCLEKLAQEKQIS